MRGPVSIIGAVVVALILAGGAFWGGMNVGKAQAQNEQNSFFANRGFDPNNLPNGANGAGGFAGNGGAGAAGGAAGRAAQRGAAGTIEKVDGNTLTVTTNQGDTVTVNLGDNAPVLKSVLGDKTDLKPGTHILAVGTRSGNNIAATGIQITDRPNGVDSIFGGAGGFFGGGGRRGTPTPTTK